MTSHYNFDFRPCGLSGSASAQQPFNHLPQLMRPSWGRVRQQWSWSQAVEDVLSHALPVPSRLEDTGLAHRAGHDRLYPSDFLTVLVGCWDNPTASDLRQKLSKVVEGQQNMMTSRFWGDLPKVPPSFTHEVTVWIWRLIRTYSVDAKRALRPWPWLIHVGIEAGLDPDTSSQLVSVLKRRWDARLTEPELWITEAEKSLVDCAHGHDGENRPFAQEWDVVSAFLDTMAGLYPQWTAPRSTVQYWQEALHHEIVLPLEYRHYQTKPFSVVPEPAVGGNQ